MLVVLSFISQALVVVDTDSYSSVVVEDSSILEELSEQDGARADEPIKIHGVFPSNTPVPVPGTNSVIFNGRDSSASPADYELWISDGTTEGTFMLKDIYSGSDSSSPSWFTPLNGKIYFSAKDDNGKELWVTDLTVNGTVMLKDIYEGENASEPRRLTPVGDKIFFLAKTQDHGEELWVTDGTADGTFMVKDINPGEDGSSIYPGQNHCPYSYFSNNEYRGHGLQCFISLGDSIVFSADEDGGGGETPRLWMSDGTQDGTFKLGEFIGTDHINRLGNEVFFSARNDSIVNGLWKTDGTEEGTVLLYEGVDIGWTHVVDDKMFFHGHNNNSVNWELWITDGTEIGTYLVKDINPEEYHNSVSDEGDSFGGKYYFFASDDTDTGTALWTSDGTEDGTYKIKDINPGTQDLWGQHIYATGCLLYTSPSPRDRQKSRMPSSA